MQIHVYRLRIMVLLRLWSVVAGQADYQKSMSNFSVMSGQCSIILNLLAIAKAAQISHNGISTQIRLYDCTVHSAHLMQAVSSVTHIHSRDLATYMMCGLTTQPSAKLPVVFI